MILNFLLEANFAYIGIFHEKAKLSINLSVSLDYFESFEGIPMADFDKNSFIISRVSDTFMYNYLIVEGKNLKITISFTLLTISKAKSEIFEKLRFITYCYTLNYMERNKNLTIEQSPYP